MVLCPRELSRHFSRVMRVLTNQYKLRQSEIRVFYENTSGNCRLKFSKKRCKQVETVESLAPARSAKKARPSMSLAFLRLHSPEPLGRLRACPEQNRMGQSPLPGDHGEDEKDATDNPENQTDDPKFAPSCKR
jgi:hypothetical protein